MEKEPTNTQKQLIESFKALLLEYPFEKITIKMITNDADVIRPTFYNYFRDKHEVFEVILDDELFDSLRGLMNIDMFQEAIKMLFAYFDKNKPFYKKAFKVTGQNSFEDLLVQKIKELETAMVSEQNLQVKEEVALLSKEQIVEFYSVNLVYGIKLWVEDEFEGYNTDEMLEVYSILMTSDLEDLIQRKG